MPPGTDLPTSPTPLEDQGQAAQVEPPSAEVQERGIPLKPLPGTALTPSGMAPPPCGDGLPTTANIIKVACAFQVKTKSLTTLVVVAPGQVLTRPVTISIVLGGYCPKVITQSYVASGILAAARRSEMTVAPRLDSARSTTSLRSTAGPPNRRV